VDKKPLIVVSLCAVVLLVMGSLSNVVGYQSVKSTVVNDSPLFSVRTTRAIHQKENVIKSNYLGKDSDVNFFKSKIDDINSTVHRFLDMVCKMDMPEVDKLITNYMKKLSLKNEKLTVNKEMLLLNLKQIQENNFKLTKFNFDFVKKYLPKSSEEEPSIGNWQAGCIVSNFIIGVLAILALIFLLSFCLISAFVRTCFAGYATCTFTSCYNTFCSQE